uniref:Copia protein n=1 Tax=Lygus hesperus TaxID=30085 RepID=A0A0A9YN54_LYGHE
MDEEKLYHVPLFDGSNFANWKFRMETLIDEKGLIELIKVDYRNQVKAEDKDDAAAKKAKEEKRVEWKKRDRKCKSVIVQRLSDSVLECAQDKESAFEIWSTLTSTYARKGMANQLLLRKSLLLMKFDPSTETLEKHFSKFDKIIRELRSTGATLDEMDVVCHLLITMPNEYSVVVTALETISEKLTVSFVRNRLMDEERKRHSEGSVEDSHSLMMKTSRNLPAGYHNRKDINKSISFKSGSDSVQTPRNQIQCNFCKKFGHMKKECRKLKKREQISNNRSAQQAQTQDDIEFSLAATTSTSGTCVFSSFYLDSGASETMAFSTTYSQLDV